MFSRDSLAKRFEIILAAACVGAHAQIETDSKLGGFRANELKFLIELFHNWIDTQQSAHRYACIQNTQVMRYLETLVREGYARKISRKGPPVYRLTRIGLLELLSRISQTAPLPAENFFFCYYFISNYRERIEQLVRNEGKLFPPALHVELQSLLDGKSLLERGLNQAKQLLNKLERRIKDAEMSAEFCAKAFQEGLAVEQVVAKVERLYPYELNSQKPLHELMSSIPVQFRSWELTKGNRSRVQQIWEPQKLMLSEFIKLMQKFLAF